MREYAIKNSYIEYKLLIKKLLLTIVVYYSYKVRKGIVELQWRNGLKHLVSSKKIKRIFFNFANAFCCIRMENFCLILTYMYIFLHKPHMGTLVD